MVVLGSPGAPDITPNMEAKDRDRGDWGQEEVRGRIGTGGL